MVGTKKIILLISVILLIGIMGLFIRKGQHPSYPPVIFILVDTLRADHLSGYGYDRPTSPFLDSLTGSFQFLDMVTQASWTLPSMASIFTSRYPTDIHVLKLIDILSPSESTLAEYFRSIGYETAAFNTNPHIEKESGMMQGFNSVFSYHFATSGEVLFDHAEKWLDQENPGDGPFFMYIHLMDVHTPYVPPKEFLSVFETEYHGDVQGTNEVFGQILRGERKISPSDLQHLVNLYDGEIRKVDHLVSRFVAQLKKRGLYEKSLFIVTSDHGEEFFEHGGLQHARTLYEELILVPLLIKFPQNELAGKSGYRPLVSGLDLFPTLVRYLTPEKALDGLKGTSFLPLLRGKERRTPFEEFSVVDLMAQKRAILKENLLLDFDYDVLYSIRTDRKKLIYNETENSFEWYDLKEDPAEKMNEFKKEEGTSRVGELKERLLDFVQAARENRDPKKSVRDLSESKIQELKALGYIHD